MQRRKPRHPAQAISCDALTLLMLVDDGKLRTIRQGLPLSTKSDPVNAVDIPWPDLSVWARRRLSGSGARQGSCRLIHAANC